MPGFDDTRHGNRHPTGDRSLSRRGVLQTAAVGAVGSLLAGRAVGRVATDTGGAVRSQETASRVRWEQTYDGEDRDHLFLDCCGTTDGGAVLAGVTSQSRRNGVPWAVKIDADGGERWNRTYSMVDDAAEILVGAVPAHDGGTVLVGGRVRAFDNDETQDRGNRDVVVRKIDADGRHQWTESHGGSEIDWAYSGVALRDSGYLFCGYTYSYTESNRHDLWARKVDNDGRTVWDGVIGTDPAFFANDAVATSDGGAVLAGGRWYERESERNHLVVKLDSNGDVGWGRTFVTSDLDSRSVAIVRTDDGYAVAGNDGDRAIVYGLNTEGREVWKLTLGRDISPGTLRNIGDGRLLVCGQRTRDASDVRWLSEVTAGPDAQSVTWEQTYGAGDVNGLTATGDTTVATGQTDTSGWAGAVAEQDGSTDDESDESTDTESGGSTDTEPREGTDTAADEDDADGSAEENTDAFGPGLGPLAALSGVGIEMYRRYARSTDE